MPAIRSQRVVTASGIGPATIHFSERIERVTLFDDAPPDVRDYGTLTIMPGLVDSHVHVNEPGRTEWEGFATATRAAAAGGITTIVDMPLNSIPPTTSADGLYEKAHALDGQCRVDVALWGGVIPGNTHELRVMLELGARGFKCFLVDSGVDEFPHVSENDLRAAATELARTKAPLLVHAELGGPITGAEAAIAGADPTDYRTYLHSRPNAAEDEAIDLLVRVCRDTGARIHIVHLSSASALDILRRAREEKLPITAETTPHYLHFEAESVPPSRLEFKCAPPIREHANRERLWDGIREGLIEMIVSDHSPCTPELKRGDFRSAWGGISSLQFLLPIVWSEAMARGYSLSDLSRWLCAAPAKLARLDGKGAIAAGHDADFVVWSPEEAFKVTPEIVDHRHKVTPYAGETLTGVVKATWLRGEPVYEDGKHCGEARGVWVR
ncbi:MAG: allantoinase AllB [Thermoanaerobaculia bacterium]|nr:allantoinase AllB [Thermoanaerobaculia bacterium]